MNLTLDERTKIFDKVCRLVATKHFDPGMNGADWNALARDRRDQILACVDPEVFEKEVHKLVAELKTICQDIERTGAIWSPDAPPLSEYGPFENQEAREDRMAKNVQSAMEKYQTGLFLLGLAHLHSMIGKLRALGFKVTAFSWLDR
jgi:hypothetical protein